MVGDRQDRQRADAVAGGDGVKLRGLHLDGKDAVAGHRLVQVGTLVVEDIGRIDAADMGRRAFRTRRRDRFLQQAVIGGGREVQFPEKAARRGGDGRGGHRHDDVAQLDVMLHRSG